MLTSVTQSCQQIQTLIDDFKVLDASKNMSGGGAQLDGMDMGGMMGMNRNMMGGMGGLGAMR